ncbi:MAG TPA: glycosyl hydrolase [Pyrinomonadaceae bacterium]
MIRKYLAIFSLLTVLSMAARAQTVSELHKNFVSPPNDSRIMMRWWWFGPSVTKGEIERELQVMKEGGIGGVEVQPVYPLLPDDPKTGHKNLPYLSDEFLEMLRFASDKARELGMRFDLTLGSGWSFGGATTPITEAAGQLRVDRVKLQGGETSIAVPSMIAAEHYVGAFLRRADGRFETLGDVRNDRIAIPGNTAGGEAIFFIGGKSGMQVKRPSVGSEGYVLNHLDKPSVDGYLKKTGDRLFEAFKGTPVPYSVFCDSLEVYNQDWTDDLLAEFQKRRGYDLRPHLPALVADVGPKTEDIRYDWGRTITELFNERFMIPMQDWSKRNGTRFRIQGYGIPPASIYSNKWADISDGEGAQWKVVRAARWASSASHIFGRDVTSSETWTWLNSPVFRATPLDLKAEADIHLLQGINQFIGHGWGYTPPYVEYPGWRFYAAGAYSEQNPWWIVMPDLALYLQRLSYLMRQGEPVNDIALYLPSADAYSHFTPGKVHLIDVNRDLVGEKLMPAIFEAGYNLDFFDDEVLQELGKSYKGTLSLGSSKHRVVVLPAIKRMPLASLKAIESFVTGGGIVIAVGGVPSMLPGFNVTDAERSEFKTIVDRIFNSGKANVRSIASETELKTALGQLLKPDVDFGSNAVDMGFVHRKTADADLYFVANTSNQKRDLRLTFRNSEPAVQMWDPKSGTATAVSSVQRGSGTVSFNHHFEPYGSRVFVFSKQSAAALPTEQDGGFIALDGTWKLILGDKVRNLSALTSWAANEDDKYFSGVGRYETSVNVPADFLNRGRVLLDFGEGTPVDAIVQRNGMRTYYDPPIRESAVIYVNGQKVGSLWAPPYEIDVTGLVKAGQNQIRIDVGNLALNYMAGRRLPDYRLLNLRYGERFQPQEMEKVRSEPSGIIGTVRLRKLIAMR